MNTPFYLRPRRCALRASRDETEFSCDIAREALASSTVIASASSSSDTPSTAARAASHSSTELPVVLKMAATSLSFDFAELVQ